MMEEPRKLDVRHLQISLYNSSCDAPDKIHMVNQDSADLSVSFGSFQHAFWNTDFV